MLKLFRRWKHKWDQKQITKEETRLHPLRVSFYRQFISPGDLVFDVGANMGNRIAVFLELKARVIAVEPQPNCIEVLQNKFGDKIIIERVALGASPGTATMHIADESGISSLSDDFIQRTGQTRFKRNKWEKTTEVTVSTIETLIKKHGVPVFCKIDVEGFETEVLKGLQTPLPCLSFEYCVPEMTDKALECVDRLNQLNPGYLFNYSIGESMNFALEQWRNVGSFKELILQKEFTGTLFGDIYCKLP
jgi:FkbM family methyltransferase